MKLRRLGHGLELLAFGVALVGGLHGRARGQRLILVKAVTPERGLLLVGRLFVACFNQEVLVQLIAIAEIDVNRIDLDVR